MRCSMLRGTFCSLITLATPRQNWTGSNPSRREGGGCGFTLSRSHSCCAVRLVYIQISPGHIWTTLYFASSWFILQQCAMCSCTVRHSLLSPSSGCASMLHRNKGTYLPIYTASHLGPHLSSLTTLSYIHWKSQKSATECLRMKLAKNLNTAQTVQSRAEGSDRMNMTVTGDENWYTNIQSVGTDWG